MKRGVVKIDKILTESDVETDEAKAKKALADAKDSVKKEGKLKPNRKSNDT
jgi:hypothetical protein